MNLTDEQLHELAALAAEAARAAGAVIAARRGGGVEVRHKSVGTCIASQVVTEVDHLAQAAILDRLEPTLAPYGLALLTEESADDGKRLERHAFWSIDPMDGTLAFIQDTPGFTVSIALVARDGMPLIGVAYDPVEGVLYRAIRGHGAGRDGRPLRAPALDPARPLILSTDFSFRDHPWFEATREGLESLAADLGLPGAAVEFHIGAVANACRVLETPNHCYFKYPRADAGGGSLWDYAATACLLQEAGGVATDIHGRPLELNRPDTTFMNHRGLLYAPHPRPAEGVTALHRRLSAPTP